MIPVVLPMLSGLVEMGEEVKRIVEHANRESEIKARLAVRLQELIEEVLAPQMDVERVTAMAAAIRGEFEWMAKPKPKPDPVKDIPPELAEILKMLSKES